MSVPMTVPFSSAHLVGIGGSGMKSLAELLQDLGVKVTGSDVNSDRPVVAELRAAGIAVDSGHMADHLPADAEALIHSPAIPDDNPERQRAAATGIPQFSLPEVIAQLMRDRSGVCIAGTHGKSTTTAMVAWILQHAGLSPSAFFGAGLCDTQRITTNDEQRRSESYDGLPRPSKQHDLAISTGLEPRRTDLKTRSRRGGWVGDGEHLVVESCEYRRNFLHYSPRHALILCIEPDHFETYPDEKSLIDAFTEFARRVQPGGTLTVNGDCPRTLRAVEEAGVAFESFGASPSSQWRVSPEDPRDFQKSLGSAAAAQSIFQSFDLEYQNEVVASITLPHAGEHNRLNAAAAAVLCLRIGVPRDAVESALRDFPGIARRFELLGEWNGLTFIDDYAHHPTAVRITLQTARALFPNRRIRCVFQPHQSARVRRLMADFAAALSLADDVLLTPAFSARETDDPAARECAEQLVALMSNNGDSARFISSLDRILPCLEDRARPGDVVLLMGAGDIERIRYDLSRRICRNHADE